ncbi:hypothetical protein RHGRI_029555 [Rhododendron griersonianum]|uniref:Transmembrane protein n=1 Tax=Rhododendron griersonianum TaxID=479676 RepID=A0AAV6IM40_9ERIC|nr:hypothetical protein RHGRI_029555 [Rhododendron griersonianum]
MIKRAMKMGSVLLEARKRSAKKHATMHNAVVWALPPDLTTKTRVDRFIFLGVSGFFFFFFVIGKFCVLHVGF